MKKPQRIIFALQETVDGGIEFKMEGDVERMKTVKPKDFTQLEQFADALYRVWSDVLLEAADEKGMTTEVCCTDPQCPNNKARAKVH